LIGKFAQKQSKVYMVVAGILGLGLGVFLLAATARVAVALASVVGLGLAASSVLLPSQTLVQQETPQTILGRVSSASAALITISQLASVAIAGKLADWIGIRNLYYLVALALAVIAVLGFIYARVGRLEQAQPASLAT
jgi:MFS family permease